MRSSYHDRGRMAPCVAAAASVVLRGTLMPMPMPMQPQATLRERSVVYLYPAKICDVTAELRVDGEVLTHYPKLRDNRWRVKAGPTGEIFEPTTERRFPYLCWQAALPGGTANVRVDLERAHCVPGTVAEPFLEKLAGKHALNDRERTDFVTYWLPVLERNNFNLVQLLTDAECDRHASLHFTPTPDACIRLFMVVRGCDERVSCGEPDVVPRARTGFTVVEWGGSIDRT